MSHLLRNAEIKSLLKVNTVIILQSNSEVYKSTTTFHFQISGPWYCVLSCSRSPSLGSPEQNNGYVRIHVSVLAFDEIITDN
jgi:meiotically up-regulated gene 157 (Mug157) protein